jgi:tetratricopeptide (TPR) repeat protein
MSFLKRLFGKSSEEIAEEHWNEGQRLYRLGQYREAIISFDKAILELAGIGPQVPALYLMLGLARARLGDLKEAIEDFEHVVSLDPAPRIKKDACHNLGKAYGQMGQYRAALRWYSQAIELDPRAPDAYCNRADMRIKLSASESGVEQLEKAVADAEKALSLNPRDRLAHRNLEVAQEMLAQRRPESHKRKRESPTVTRRRVEEARETVERIIEVGDEQRFEQVIKLCDGVLADRRWASLSDKRHKLMWEIVMDEKAFALWNLGLQRGNRTLISEALGCCNRGLELHSQSERLWGTKGLILAELGRYEEAVNALEKSIGYVSPSPFEDEESVAQRVQIKQAAVQKLETELRGRGRA